MRRGSWGWRGERTRRKKKLRFLKLTQLIIENMPRNPSPLPKQKYMYFSHPPPPRKKIRNCSNYNYISKPPSIANLAFLRCELSARSPNVNGNETDEPPNSNFHIRKA